MPKIEIDQSFVRKNEIWRAVGSVEKLEMTITEKIIPIPLKDTLLKLYNHNILKVTQ